MSERIAAKTRFCLASSEIRHTNGARYAAERLKKGKTMSTLEQSSPRANAGAEEQALALFAASLTDWKTEAQHRTVEELRALMHEILPGLFKRLNRNTTDLARKRLNEALKSDYNLAAQFYVTVIVNIHFKRLIFRAWKEEAPREHDGSWKIKKLTDWLLDYAVRARKERYPPHLRPAMPTRQKLASLVANSARLGIPRSRRW